MKNLQSVLFSCGPQTCPQAPQSTVPAGPIPRSFRPELRCSFLRVLGVEERQQPHGYRWLSLQRTRQQQCSVDDSANHRSAELMQPLRYFSTKFLPKMKPNSSTPRNWSEFVPAWPKTLPGV